MIQVCVCVFLFSVFCVCVCLEYVLIVCVCVSLLLFFLFIYSILKSLFYSSSFLGIPRFFMFVLLIVFTCSVVQFESLHAI